MLNKMIWYKASLGNIREVEVIKETEKQLVIKPKFGSCLRRNKVSDCECYFKTWKEAFDYILNKLDASIKSGEHSLKYRIGEKEKFLEKYSGLRCNNNCY
jgi:hypothetical protein